MTLASEISSKNGPKGLYQNANILTSTPLSCLSYLASISAEFVAYLRICLFCRKIFVGGIPATTTKSKLMHYFAEFGAIDDCIIMVDRDHKPRGFGFVTF